MLFLPKQAFLFDISTRETCTNASLNHSNSLHLTSQTHFHCKSYGASLCIQLVTSNHKSEETIIMQILHTLTAYFNALMNFKNLKNVVLGFNIT